MWRVLLLVLLGLHTAAADEDAPLTRSTRNPLLVHGPVGSYDALKLGPRAILRLAPTDWRMWYEAAPSGNKSFTAYATSTDGLTWTRYPNNPVMSPSELWEGGANNVEGEDSPTSILKEHGVFKLWYHGYTGNGVRQIGYATSPDGIAWTKYAGNPVLTPGASGTWDADSVCEPNVVHVADNYFMYYSHCVGDGGIGLATSTDGVSWTKYAGNPIITTGPGWESAQIDWGAVYYDGAKFHIWYLGHQGTGGFSLGYASSTDGMTFTKSAANPVLPPPMPLIVNTDYAVNKGDGLGIENSAKVLRLGAMWRFYYGGFASCCPEDATLSMATAPVKTSPNRAPEVDAGADQTLDPMTAQLAGTVMDDDVPVALDQVQLLWSVTNGPGTVQFSAPTSLTTTATFSAPGAYLVRLSASDTALTGSAEVTISVGGVINGGDDPAGSSPSSSGCGCTTGSPTTSAALLWFGVALIVLRRRRSKQRDR
jgi:MYXO-CTERM domain-containing protein